MTYKQIIFCLLTILFIVYAIKSPDVEQYWEGSNLFTFSTNNGVVQQLTFTAGYRNDPALSPDGRKAAYFEQDLDNEENSHIFIMDLDGANVTQLTFDDSRNHSPSWSPDGKRLLYIHSEEFFSLYVYDFDAGFASPCVELISQNIFAADW